jgi:hypothetical protein
MLSLDSKTTDLLKFVERWFGLMAEGRVDAALSQLDEPNAYGISWTKEAIERLLSETLGRGRYLEKHPEGPRFTAPDAATGKPRADVLAFDDGSGYSVEHDVPLNGEWSDLTAQFEFLRREAGYAVVLHDLHVL